MDNIHLSNALISLWSIISRTNKYIDETAPWVLAKEEQIDKLNAVMYHLVENLRKIAIMIQPLMEETAKKIFNQLGIENEELKKWETLSKNDIIPEGTTVINKGEPLFVRLDKEEEIEYIKQAMNG